MPPPPTKILLVDDSALYRQSIRNVLREVQGVEVVGSADNGLDALEKIVALKPDLLTLDVQMPDMDGIALLREIKRKGLPPKAIMVSSYTSNGAQVTTDALMEGAFDFILKPTGDNAGVNRCTLRDALAEKILAFRSSFPDPSSVADVGHGQAATAIANQDTESVPTPTSACRAVIIGTSTGGPAALKRIVPKLPLNLPIPILIVQHMPEKYTLSLARRLDAISPLEVVEASDQMEATAGRIILAAGGKQLKVVASGDKLNVHVTQDDPENGVRPAVDYTLRSVIEAVDGNALAVILTGMGRDGLAGCRALKQAGGNVFAQSQSDCVVYGMPKAVIDAELADRTLTLGKIAPAICRHIKRSRREPV